MEGFLKDRGTPGPRFPAVSMSQFAAKQYTEWLSKKTGRFYRLPSEAEWEYACRAGTTTAYSFGEDPEKLKEHAWCAANSQWQNDLWYRRVGRKQPNPWGLYDMHGNVAEWCIDQYDVNWYRQFDRKTVNWHDTINWPKTRYPCVIRGGNYQSQQQDCRSAARMGSSRKMNRYDPQYPKSPHWEADGVWVGFRVLSPVKEPPDAEKRRWWFDPDPVTAKTIERDREHHEIVEPPVSRPSTMTQR
jgi:formylglycine-generating enzyme required for sulfatase activity